MAVKDFTPEQLTERNLDPTIFCGHYSDENMYIRKIGTLEIYAESIDLIPCTFEYVETEKPIYNEKTI